MTLINFSRNGTEYHAEVLLGRDLQLDEILQVDRVARSGALHTVADPVDLEDAIEAELARRKEDLRAARDESRRVSRPSKKRALVEKPLASGAPPAVESHSTSGTTIPVVHEVGGVTPIPVVAEVHGNADTTVAAEEHRIMVFNLKGVAAKTGRATFQQEGGKNVVKFGKTAFEGNVVPDAITIEAPFKAPKVPVAQMTKEERKAVRDSKPKKTKAEKLAALDARAAKLRASLEL